MGQIKAKTMIQKMGFVDSDRTPEHDKIQLWLYKNITQVICELFSIQKETFEIKRNELEYEFSVGNYIGGFIDLRVMVHKIGSEDHEAVWGRFYFEVKNKIPSLGELLRQMNFYKHYLGQQQFGPKVYFVVVSPVDDYKDILREQGILFYKYQDPEKLF